MNKIFISIFVGILVVFLLVDSVSAVRTADYYFDSQNGNNANNGLTPSTAKKDLDGLSALGTAINGKTIAFRDGMYYRGSSSTAAILLTNSMNNVRITNWDGDDSTNLPIIAASYKLEGWTNVGGNIWQMTGTHRNSLVFTFPNGTMAWGMGRTSQSALTKEFDFYRDGNTMYVYSPSDPDTRYESVDSWRQTYIIQNYGDYNEFDHLDLRFGGGGGMIFESGGEYSTFRDSRLLFSGDSVGLMTCQGSDGIYVFASHTQVLRNYVKEVSRHVVYIYTWDGSPIDDVLVEGNTLINGHYNFFDMNGAGPITNVRLLRNVAHETPYEAYRDEPSYTCRNGGFWTNGGVQSVTIAYNLVYDLYEAPVMDFRVGKITAYNNILVQSRPGTTKTVVYSSGGSGSVFKNNIIYAATGGSAGSLPSGSSNNYVGNPGFVSFSSSDFSKRDFHLTANSPAINYGVDVGYTYDLDGNPIVGAPDAGAYEYTTGVQCAPADTNCDGCINLGEVSAYVASWLNGQITLGQCSSAVSTWLGGCQ